jgi:hypothetical protein
MYILFATTQATIDRDGQHRWNEESDDEEVGKHCSAPSVGGTFDSRKVRRPPSTAPPSNRHLSSYAKPRPRPVL